LFRDYTFFAWNKNISSIDTYQINLYNLSNSLIVYDNSTTLPIYGTNQAYNLTLEPNQYVTVYNTLTIDERNPIANYPIYFSSSSYTSKHIAANLSEGINATVIINVYDCDTVGTISYTPENESSYNPSYTCSNNQVTFSTLKINPALNSNLLTISYNQAQLDTCNGFGNAGESFGSFIMILIIVGVAGFVILLLTSGDASDIDLNALTIMIVIAGVIIALGMIIISNINGC
jgi:hypothetical protein